MDFLYIAMLAVGLLTLILGGLSWAIHVNEENEEEMNRILNRWPKEK